MSIEQKYIYNGALLTRQELHLAGVLLGNAQPEEATVYSDDAGALGTRYTSESDGIIVKSEGDIYYYATQAECDAEWTTEEPVPEYFDTGWGEPVTIPTGYHVKAVKTSVGYAKKLVNMSMGLSDFWVMTPIVGNLGQFGTDHGFTKDDITFGEAGKPCLQIFIPTTITESGSTGYYWTYRHTQTPTTHGDADYTDMNKLGFDVRVRQEESSGIYYDAFFAIAPEGRLGFASSLSSTTRSNINTVGYPWQFRYYDADNVQVTYKFHLPTSLYTISGNTFTWNGDATSDSSLAFWYKRLGITAIRIWLEKD